MKKLKEKKLIITFIILLMIVIVLGTNILFLEKNKHNSETVDIVIPLIKEKTNYTFKVTLNNLKKDKKIVYKFKTTNYRKKKINKKKIKYNLNISSQDNIDVKLYSSDKEYKDTAVTSELISGKKTEKIYKLIIKSKTDIKESTIIVNIDT